MTHEAIIIGGGIGGLAAAVALRQAGIEVTVYERAPVLGRVGAGLSLWNNALYALQRLGLAEAVIGASAVIQRTEIRTQRGGLLARSLPEKLEQRMGLPTVGIHRAALQYALLHALPEGVVQLGKTFERFEQDPRGVTAIFSDGDHARAELLVGADGINSLVRQQLFPALSLRYAGYTAWRGIAPTRGDLQAGVAVEGWGCGQRFGLLRVNRMEIYWFAVENAPPGQILAPEERKAALMQRFGGWADPATHLIELTPQDAILQNDIYDFAPLAAWGSGRVVLLGDAAHATTPNMGQGAGQALESAVVLGDCLAQQADDPAAAFARYQGLRQVRTDWITRQSRRIGAMAQASNPLLCWLRDALVRLAPAAGSAILERAAGYKVGDGE